MLEMLYPLLQGYDSVARRRRIQLGGTDQTFNLLFAREIQRAYGRPEQAILTMPLLVGIDGRQKMSKSLGNQIWVTDPPEEIYGKTMSVHDELMATYYRLLLGTEPPDLPPRDAKRALARGLVERLYSPEQAQAAERHFDNVFVDHGVPDDLAESTFACADGEVHLPAVIAGAFSISRSEARRLIDQGGVTLGEVPWAPASTTWPTSSPTARSCAWADGASCACAGRDAGRPARRRADMSGFSPRRLKTHR